MITSSTLRIYTDKFCQNLHETVNVTGSDLHADTSTLAPGKAYWATVEVVDSVAGTSPESNPYKFFSLPDITLSLVPVVTSNSFTRPTAIFTNTVAIADHGLLWTTDPNWSSRPGKVSGNTVSNLQENTVYYYRPWVTDEFGRTYVNVDDTDSVRTGYSVPLVKITQTYTPTSTTFGGRVEVTSTTTVTSVVAECVSGGTTITTNLVAATGEQEFQITGLAPFTKYHLTITATNGAGEGVSQTVYFTTTEEEQPEGMVEILSYSASTISDQIKAVSLVKHEEGTSIVSHKAYLFDNSEHSGEPLFTYDGGEDEIMTALFTGVEPDTTYFIFSSVVIDGGVEPETYWSEGYEVHTYSLIEIGEITTTNTTASFEFEVEGFSSETEIEWSSNGESWRRVVLENPQEGEVTITGLSPDTTYYLRARVANSNKEYSSYYTTTFTTKNITISITGFTKSGNNVIVGINITE